MQPIKVDDIRIKSMYDTFDDDTLHAEIYGLTPAKYGNATYNTFKEAFIKLPFETPKGTHSATIFTYGDANSYISNINFYGYNHEDGIFTYYYNARTGEIVRAI